jgi:hypothetical protein
VPLSVHLRQHDAAMHHAAWIGRSPITVVRTRWRLSF